MKQHITLEQLNELDDVAIRKLAEYKGLEEFDKTTIEVWRKSDNEFDTDHLLLNIGQMIEFLLDEGIFESTWDGQLILPCFFDDGSDLCDALWEKVKSILEK